MEYAQTKSPLADSADCAAAYVQSSSLPCGVQGLSFAFASPISSVANQRREAYLAVPRSSLLGVGELAQTRGGASTQTSPWRRTPRSSLRCARPREHSKLNSFIASMRRVTLLRGNLRRPEATLAPSATRFDLPPRFPWPHIPQENYQSRRDRTSWKRGPYELCCVG